MAKQNAQTGFQTIPISKLRSNPSQPRQQWNDAKDEEGRDSLQRLGESIKNEGVLQPLVVTKNGSNGTYTIVCGERRFQAAKKYAKLKTVPCIIKPDLNEKQMIEMAVTENLQREDLSDIDIARSYKILMEKCGHTQRSLAKQLGISMASINYKLSLLDLSPELQQDIKKGNLSATQGRAIIQSTRKIPNTDQKAQAMKEIKQKIDDNGKKKLDVKEVKTIAKSVVEKSGKAKSAVHEKPKLKPESKEEVTQRDTFLKALQTIKDALNPFETVINDNIQRGRFAEVLYQWKNDAAEHIKNHVTVLIKLHSEVEEVMRKQMLT